jgi:phosphatidylglycerophosphate synthase
VLERRNAEHWLALLYTRRLSLPTTRWLVTKTRITANAVTYAMWATGLCSALLLAVPGVAGPILAAIGIQLYLLLDCIDGEVARWRHTTSPRGVYLDRIGHYIVEAAFLTMLGVRVGGSLDSPWTSVGLLTAVLALIAKAETDLVAATIGPERIRTDNATSTPRHGLVRTLRRLLYPIRVHRATGAIEASLLLVAATIIRAAGWDSAERVLALALLAIAVAVAVGHLTVILSSGRLDPPVPVTSAPRRRNGEIGVVADQSIDAEGHEGHHLTDGITRRVRPTGASKR